MLPVAVQFIRDLVEWKSQYRKGTPRFEWNGRKFIFPEGSALPVLRRSIGSHWANVNEYYHYFYYLLEKEADGIVAEANLASATMPSASLKIGTATGARAILRRCRGSDEFNLYGDSPRRYGDLVVIRSEVNMDDGPFLGVVTKGSARPLPLTTTPKKGHHRANAGVQKASARVSHDSAEGFCRIMTYTGFPLEVDDDGSPRARVNVSQVGYIGNLIQQVEALDTFALYGQYLAVSNFQCNRSVSVDGQQWYTQTLAQIILNPDTALETNGETYREWPLRSYTGLADDPSSLVMRSPDPHDDAANQSWSALSYVEEANESQVEAVVHMRSNLDWLLSVSRDESADSEGTRIQVVHGPPGTGKTRTVTVLLGEIVAHHHGSGRPTYKSPASILVTAPSNVAVDNVIVTILRNGIPCGEVVEKRLGKNKVGLSLLPPPLNRMGDRDVNESVDEIVRTCLSKALKDAMQCTISSTDSFTPSIIGGGTSCATTGGTTGSGDAFNDTGGYRRGYMCPTMVRVGEPLGGWTSAESVPFQLSLKNILARVKRVMASRNDYNNTVIPDLRAQLKETRELKHIVTASRGKDSGTTRAGSSDLEEGTELYEGRFRAPKVLDELETAIESRLASLAAQERILASLDHFSEDKLDALICRRIIDEADVVFCTLAGSNSPYFCEKQEHGVKHFDVVIVDEAAQASELETLVALYPTRARPHNDTDMFNRQAGSGTPGTRPAGNMRFKSPYLVTLVGDHCQLPPTVNTRDAVPKEMLETSFFNRMYAKPAVHTAVLNMQYRMHPYISSFISRTFYNGRIRDGQGVQVEPGKFYKWWHHQQDGVVDPVMFLDTANVGTGTCFKMDGGSLYNDDEVALVERMVRAFLYAARERKESSRTSGGSKSEPVRILVLSPYTEQVRRIQDCLAAATVLDVCFEGSSFIQLIDFLRKFDISVEIKSIDGSQGQEADVVIVSSVRAHHVRDSDPSLKRAHYPEIDGIGFLKDLRRINVALSRGRYSVVVFGDSRLLSLKSPEWAAFTAYCKELGTLRAAPKPARYSSGAPHRY